MKTTHRQKDVHWISNNDLVVFAAGDKIEGHNSLILETAIETNSTARGSILEAVWANYHEMSIYY